MDKDKIIVALDIGTIEWRKHALEQMLERDISRTEVKRTLRYGEGKVTFTVDFFRYIVRPYWFVLGEA